MAPAPYASWGRRVVGWLIDFVIVLIPNSIIVLAGHGWYRTYNINGTSMIHIRPIYGLISAVIALVYGMLFVGSNRGQTPGMMAMGMRAIDPNTGGSIGYGRALWRAFFEYLMSVVIFIPWVIDMLWPLWDKCNQTLHDKVSNTVVIRTG
jgi:uncharacterized RDD family membrane protein YckC